MSDSWNDVRSRFDQISPKSVAHGISRYVFDIVGVDDCLNVTFRRRSFICVLFWNCQTNFFYFKNSFQNCRVGWLCVIHFNLCAVLIKSFFFLKKHYIKKKAVPVAWDLDSCDILSMTNPMCNVWTVKVWSSW